MAKMPNQRPSFMLPFTCGLDRLLLGVWRRLRLFIAPIIAGHHGRLRDPSPFPISPHCCLAIVPRSETTSQPNPSQSAFRPILQSSLFGGRSMSMGRLGLNHNWVVTLPKIPPNLPEISLSNLWKFRVFILFKSIYLPADICFGGCCLWSSSLWEFGLSYKTSRYFLLFAELSDFLFELFRIISRLLT